jgi:signal transduction histidine kinase
VHDLETHYRTRDGRVVPVLLYADRVVVADGRGPAIVCVALDMTELVRSREQLARSRERLRALARHLNATVEAERTAIAREVHDQLGQALTCVKLDVHRLRDELVRADPEVAARVRPRIAAMSEIIDESVRTVRKVATDLRPAALDDLGLGAALEALAERFGERTGIRCVVEEADAAPLSPGQSTALYRIAQEALTNVARHAQATRVALRLRAEAGAVVLEIDDDGRGITPSEVAAAHSLGVLGMQERAHEQGASLLIDGAAGRGTTVRVELALEAVPAPAAPAAIVA